MLERTDVVALARSHRAAVRASCSSRTVDVDVVLMVGVGAANAGELVVDGRGVAFVCLEHFTGSPIRETAGTRPRSRADSALARARVRARRPLHVADAAAARCATLIEEAGGYYSYWDTGRRAPLRELLVNEGLAVHVSRAISPGHAAWEYFGFGRRQYARVRELEPVMAAPSLEDLDRAGLGLRLRYLSGGMSDEARTVDRYVLPERSGYYLGARMVEPAVARARAGVGGARQRASELGRSSHAQRRRLRSVDACRDALDARHFPTQNRRNTSSSTSSTSHAPISPRAHRRRARRCTAATVAGSAPRSSASRNALELRRARAATAARWRARVSTGASSSAERRVARAVARRSPRAARESPRRSRRSLRRPSRSF